MIDAGHAPAKRDIHFRLPEATHRRRRRARGCGAERRAVACRQSESEGANARILKPRIERGRAAGRLTVSSSWLYVIDS